MARIDWTNAVLCLAVGVCWLAAAGGQELFFPASAAEFHYMGRFQPGDNQSMSFDWSSSTVGFSLLLKAGGAYSVSAQLVDTSQNWYKVFVNGVAAFDFQTGAGTTTYPLGADFSAGVAYDVALQKRTEAANNGLASVFLGVSVSDPAVQLLQPPSCCDRRMLFYGDSITCGYADLGNASSDCAASTTLLEDNYWSYGPVVARKFNAAYQVVAWSGKGVVRNYGDPNQLSVCPNCPMPYYFNKTVGTDPALIYPFAQFVPDAIVCNLGTNDFSTQPQPTQQQFESGYQQLVAQFRQAYPAAQIFLACGPMTTQLVCGYVKNVAAATAANYIDLMVLPSSDPTMWSCSHPTVKGQAIMAEAAYPVIGSVMHWQ